MKRRIIEIDQDACNGCGICVDACHEGAITLKNGKAILLRDDYCDGLGDCLPTCPCNAISFIEKDTLPYDEVAVKKNMQKKQTSCCSSLPQAFSTNTSMLSMWPIQLQLVPIQAPFFHHASVLIAADCTAFAYGNMYHDFMKEKVVLIGCPKLDVVNYADKLTDIFHQNDIQDVHVVRLEVPCCKGIEQAVKIALQQSGKDIPWHSTILTRDGKVAD